MTHDLQVVLGASGGVGHALAGEAIKQLPNLLPIDAGAVRIDGERIQDPRLRLKAGSDVVIKVGKRRIARVQIG